MHLGKDPETLLCYSTGGRSDVENPPTAKHWGILPCCVPWAPMPVSPRPRTCKPLPIPTCFAPLCCLFLGRSWPLGCAECCKQRAMLRASQRPYSRVAAVGGAQLADAMFIRILPDGHKGGISLHPTRAPLHTVLGISVMGAGRALVRLLQGRMQSEHRVHLGAGVDEEPRNPGSAQSLERS